MTIQPLPGGHHPSFTDDLYRYYLVLFFPFTFFHDALPILSHVWVLFFRQRGRERTGKEGRGEGPGPLYVYIPEKLSNKSKFESPNEKKGRGEVVKLKV